MVCVQIIIFTNKYIVCTQTTFGLKRFTVLVWGVVETPQSWVRRTHYLKISTFVRRSHYPLIIGVLINVVLTTLKFLRRTNYSQISVFSLCQLSLTQFFLTQSYSFTLILSVLSHSFSVTQFFSISHSPLSVISFLKSVLTQISVSNSKCKLIIGITKNPSKSILKPTTVLVPTVNGFL